MLMLHGDEVSHVSVGQRCLADGGSRKTGAGWAQGRSLSLGGLGRLPHLDLSITIIP